MLDKSVLRIIFHYHVEAGFVQNYKFVHLRKYTCNRSTAIIVFLSHSRSLTDLQNWRWI